MKKLNKENIVKILINIFKEFCNENEIKIDVDISENTKLYGGDGYFDSMNLVSFIVEVEDTIADDLGVDIVLADEKAMSRRTSPFSRISNLAEYIVELLNDIN